MRTRYKLISDYGVGRAFALWGVCIALYAVAMVTAGLIARPVETATEMATVATPGAATSVNGAQAANTIEQDTPPRRKFFADFEDSLPPVVPVDQM